MQSSAANFGSNNGQQLKLGEDLHMIIEGLYLGNYQAVMNVERLRRLVSKIRNNLSVQT